MAVKQWLNPHCKRCSAALGLFLLLYSPSLAADTRLKVDVLRLPENAEVEISASPADSLKATKADLDNKPDVIATDTKNQKFRLYMDLSTIKNLKDAYYLYDVYVTGGGHSVPAGFRLRANPIGVFDDGWREINFEIDDGVASDSGTIRIPIHSFSPKDPLSADESSGSIHEVYLGDESHVHVQLQNSLGDMGISIDPKAEVTSDEMGYWSGIKIDPWLGSTNIVLQKQAREKVFDIALRPNVFQALTASLPPSRDGQAHSKVSVSINYHVDYGGADRRIEIQIPIRFVPSIWTIFIVVVVGGFLGATLCVLLPTRRPKRMTIAAVISAIVFALIVEVIGMILVANNSKLVLLGIELNPFQLLTSCIIGVLCGAVVMWRADAIQTFFDRLVTRAEHS